MPVVYVSYDDRRLGRKSLLQLVFPRRTACDAPEYARWDWPELHAGVSSIQGFGLYPRSSEALSWDKLVRPVALPYLGKETEVESSTQARVLRSVLCGNFDFVRQEELDTPKGYEWVQDGIYVTLMERADRRRSGLQALRADSQERLIQVAIEPDFDARGVFSFDEGDEQACSPAMRVRPAESACSRHNERASSCWGLRQALISLGTPRALARALASRELIGELSLGEIGLPVGS